MLWSFMKSKFLKILPIFLLAISIFSFCKAGLDLYFYINPKFSSEKLYKIYQDEQRRQHQKDSFAMALDDFATKTKNSGGKAVMAVLNVPEKQPQEDISSEFNAKNNALTKMIFSLSSGILFLILYIIFRKNNKLQ